MITKRYANEGSISHEQKKFLLSSFFYNTIVTTLLIFSHSQRVRLALMQVLGQHFVFVLEPKLPPKNAISYSEIYLNKSTMSEIQYL